MATRVLHLTFSAIWHLFMGLPIGKTPELLADFVNEQPMKVKIIIVLIIVFIIIIFH